MDIVLSPTSGKPMYQQLFEQISSQIIKGDLARDYCLPPIRTVAKELRISVIPVKQAWEELERRGFIYSMVGKGCFVAPLTMHDLKNKRNDMAVEKMKKDAAYYKELGLSLDEVLRLFSKHYDS